MGFCKVLHRMSLWVGLCVAHINVGEITDSFRGGGKETWAFSPPHLQGGRDNQLGLGPRFLRQDIAKVPFLVFLDHHTPEAVR